MRKQEAVSGQAYRCQDGASEPCCRCLARHEPRVEVDARLAQAVDGRVARLAREGRGRLRELQDRGLQRVHVCSVQRGAVSVVQRGGRSGPGARGHVDDPPAFTEQRKEALCGSDHAAYVDAQRGLDNAGKVAAVALEQDACVVDERVEWAARARGRDR